MTEPNNDTNQKPDTTSDARSGNKPDSAKATAAAAKARHGADKATAPAARTAKDAADKTAGKAGDAASAASSGAERAAGAATAAAQSAAKGVEAGRQAVIATTGQVAGVAKTAWTVIAHRKVIAAGVGAGLTALTAASYAVGRRSAHHAHGPVTRLTGGRI
ncbi:hypothetical protein AB0G32_21420 [Streptomyces sp. NPDC023723]|uniref:hypothetical protein n=1 Tax=Streptomyces sp. NPDC023723 TaxID=3154323 RepID=UPI0033F2DDA8